MRSPFARLFCPAALPGALAFLLLLVSPSSAELYEWTDDSGRVHYTNEPRPGSNLVGLAPIALPPEAEGQPEAAPGSTDTIRRERLKLQSAERWVDSQDEFPTQTPGATTGDRVPPATDRPAAPAHDDHGMRDRECQARHGMSCLQFETWLQVNGFDCAAGEAGNECRATAKTELEKQARAKARRRLQLEDEARERAAPRPGDYR